MNDPLEELMNQNAEMYDRFIKENEQLDRAFRNGALGEFVQSQKGAGKDGSESDKLERETGKSVLEGQNR